MSANCDITVDEGVSCPVSEQTLAKDASLVLVSEGVARDCLVSISVVDDERMRELNREWRGQDRPTDVLSLECERPDDPALAPQEPCELGDIVLAPAYIARQAKAYGTTAADEFRLLFVHGMLHLLGYDHLADEEAQLMEEHEDRILAHMGLEHVPDRVRFTRHSPEEES